MREYEQDHIRKPFNLQSLLQVIRAVAAVLGIIAIIIGLVYATRVFASIYTALHDPESFQEHLAKWVTAVGGEQLDIVIAGTTYPCANVIAIIALGGGAIILAWISMGLVLAGAKTVSWTLGDHEAIKRLLLHTINLKKPEPNKPSAADAK